MASTINQGDTYPSVSLTYFLKFGSPVLQTWFLLTQGDLCLWSTELGKCGNRVMLEDTLSYFLGYCEPLKSKNTYLLISHL